MKNIEYKDLPQQIRSIIPKNVVSVVFQISPTKYKIKITYCGSWDTWNLINGKWEFYNPK